MGRVRVLAAEALQNVLSRLIVAWEALPSSMSSGSSPRWWGETPWPLGTPQWVGGRFLGPGSPDEPQLPER